MNRQRVRRSSGPAVAQPHQRRLDESMTLLREVMERPLDPGYAAAAERRRQAAEASSAEPGSGGSAGYNGSGTGRILSASLTAVLAVLAGFGLVVAVGVVRQPADSAAKAREQLQARIEQTETGLREGELRNARLRSDIAAAQQIALGSQGGELQAEQRRLGGLTGALAVSGPGVEVTVDDAPSTDDRDVGADPRADEGTDAGIVLDLDLQNIVNGLWAAGAEAISINGQRLTALSAIRSAGAAILVDFRPMVPPYTVLAIGDQAGLQTTFAASSAGSYAQMLREHNIEVSIDGRDKLALPAAGQVGTRLAKPLPEPSPSPTASKSSSRSASSQPKGTSP